MSARIKFILGFSHWIERDKIQKSIKIIKSCDTQAYRTEMVVNLNEIDERAMN